MEESNSSGARAPRKALAPSRTEVRQSYMLLAFGILIALVVPFLLQQRTAAPSAGPAVASSGARPSAPLP